ncbi:MAG: hypothetical protein KKG76_10805 [Euryarchaeota archaeon]|nr:hypothetical protein [Euryarchaeota archaeon]
MLRFKRLSIKNVSKEKIRFHKLSKWKTGSVPANEFLQKLAPCIEHGEVETCVEEEARVAGEIWIGAEMVRKLIIMSCELLRAKATERTAASALY